MVLGVRGRVAAWLMGLCLVGTASSCGLPRGGTGTEAAPPSGGACTPGSEVSDGAVQGDCKKRVCDASGAVVEVPDDDDAPDDGDQCSEDGCSGGEPQHDPAADGTACGATLALSCAGGVCMGCENAAECPAGTPCRQPVCGNDTACSFEEVAPGTEVDGGEPDDCMHEICNDDGLIETSADPDEIPAPDEDPCTAEVCSASGTVLHMPADDGVRCASGYCLGGVCEECADSTHCPQPPTCKIAVCSAGSCEQANAENGVIGPGAPGDCQVEACQNGSLVIVEGDDPQPDPDPNDCKVTACNGGEPITTDEDDYEDCSPPSLGHCCEGDCVSVGTFCDPF